LYLCVIWSFPLGLTTPSTRACVQSPTPHYNVHVCANVTPSATPLRHATLSYKRTHVLSSYLQCLTFRPLLLTVSRIRMLRVLSSLCNCNWTSSAHPKFAPPYRSRLRVVTVLKAQRLVFFCFTTCAPQPMLSRHPSLTNGPCTYNGPVYFNT